MGVTCYLEAMLLKDAGVSTADFIEARKRVMTMEQPIDKFQTLLREMFQFDCADLDFGIYRIMNHKREVIEKFISDELPRAVANELSRGGLAEQAQAMRELEVVRRQAREVLGEDALDDDGKLNEVYHATPFGKRYLVLSEKAAGGRSREGLETDIFNHLYSFFNRYYQDGDFISKRRYSRKQRYAIPYNGEEVYLYWANHDQYYIKTGEHFRDYSFAARDVTVRCKLRAADVEQNNIKGEARFFIPYPGELAWDAEARRLVIPFEFRPLMEQEAAAYGSKGQQDKINAEAAESIPKLLSSRGHLGAFAALTAERRKTGDGTSVSFLEHHLRQYTRRNTSDFFIHKDLKGFLSRELDFYLKNEVLNLDEVEGAGEDRSAGWFQLMRVIKAVGGHIIDFLDQIESFQKMLWEKRKFVTETQYCITAGAIDERFYPGIAACDAQWAEWKELFHIDEAEEDLFTSGKTGKERRIAFLKTHPTLVVDTKHLDRDFTDELLGSMPDLDGSTDGLLIHSENWQALNILSGTYKEHVKCIYIDPPYNRGDDDFVYKDSYQHSSWLAMMRDRLCLGLQLLDQDGIQYASIDDNEADSMTALLRRDFGAGNHLATLARRTKVGGGSAAHHFAVEHDYVVVWAKDRARARPLFIPHDPEYATRYSESDDKGRYFWDTMERSSTQTTPYRIKAPDGQWLEGKWFRSEESFLQDLEAGEVRFLKKADGSWSVQFKQRMGNGKKLRSLLSENEFKSRQEDLDDLGLPRGLSYPKPVSLISTLVQAATEVGCGVASVLDYFAGSGTTGEAVISLNRADGAGRRFILVEMGHHFFTLLLPRIKKVTFAPEWKDGRPKRMATAEEAERSPRIVKYIRLESYEDALNNIEFDDATPQATLKFQDYLLRYMLRWETRKSETLLNVGKLARPFAYKLSLTRDGETADRPVDIPETFNYLIGLHVTTRKIHDDGGRRYLVYRGVIDHRQVAVIWRETEGWQKADLERDRNFVADRKLADGADEVFVNGDSFIPGARALEPVFKARMFAAVEA